MNEFTEMLKEAFLGEEPYDPAPERAAMEQALRSLEARERMLRYMMWFAAVFMTGLCVWSAWSFFTAGVEASTKALVLYATTFLFASQGVGWAKMFLFTTQKHFQMLKELKRVQLALHGRESS